MCAPSHLRHYFINLTNFITYLLPNLKPPYHLALSHVLCFITFPCSSLDCEFFEDCTLFIFGFPKVPSMVPGTWIPFFSPLYNLKSNWFSYICVSQISIKQQESFKHSEFHWMKIVCHHPNLLDPKGSRKPPHPWDILLQSQRHRNSLGW